MRIQGIRKYHDLESYIEKDIMDNKELLEDIIGIKFLSLHMEVRIGNYRVDLVGQVEDSSMVLVETSIRQNSIKDFHIHRNQIQRILEYIGEDKFVRVILISPQFLNDDIKEVESYITSYNTIVYFIQLSNEAIYKLQNSSDIQKTIENNRVGFNYYLSVKSKIINKNNLFDLPLCDERNGNYISKAILLGLRDNVNWHMPLYRYKNLTKNVIRIGSGVTDVMFNIYCNKDDLIKIEINFANNYDLFNIFKNYMIDMSEYISYPLNISNKKAIIYSEVPINKNESRIETAVNVAKRYLEYVTSMYKKIKF